MVVPLTNGRNWDQTGSTYSLQTPYESHLHVLLLPLVVRSVCSQREGRERAELWGGTGVDGHTAAPVPSRHHRTEDCHPITDAGNHGCAVRSAESPASCPTSCACALVDFHPFHSSVRRPGGGSASCRPSTSWRRRRTLLKLGGSLTRRPREQQRPEPPSPRALTPMLPTCYRILTS